MGAVIDMLRNRTIVKKNSRGWIAIIIENRRRMVYQFEREEWARKFAEDQDAAWSVPSEARSGFPRTR